MKAYVRDDVCIGCGACVEICPKIFHMTDKGVAHAIDNDIPKDLLGLANDASESCPVDAIDIDE